MAGPEVPPPILERPGSSAPISSPPVVAGPEVPPVAQAPAPEVPPVEAPQEVQEAGSSGDQAGTEEKTSTGEPPAEEKTSTLPDAPEPDDYTGEKEAEYYAGGRRHTDAQINEILDWFILTGELPDYVTDRQKRDYKRHPRLEMRRLYLQNAGLITQLSELIRNAEDPV